VRLVRWFVDEGAVVHRGTRIAIIEASTRFYEVITNGEGFLREKLANAEDELRSSNPMAVIAADGENIPYGRPYSLSGRLVISQPQP
jgi:pyruvate/2-oxoglutarate dehydrogenase complex dihydrolipoamide acyltransferase (E2) component